MRLWSVESADLIREFEFEQSEGVGTGRGPRVNCVAMQGNETIASGSSNLGGSHIIRLWDAKTGQALKEIESPKGGVNAMSFLPGGRQLLTGGRSTKRGFTQDGRDLSSKEFRDSVQLWNVESGKCLVQFNGVANPASGDSRSVNDVTVSSDGRLISTAERGGTIEIYDTYTGDRISSLRHAGEVHAVKFSGDGRRFVSLGTDLTALVWDINEIREQQK